MSNNSNEICAGAIMTRNSVGTHARHSNMNIKRLNASHLLAEKLMRAPKKERSPKG
jgi:hypothetical protein